VIVNKCTHNVHDWHVSIVRVHCVRRHDLNVTSVTLMSPLILIQFFLHLTHQKYKLSIDAQLLEIQGSPWGFGQILLRGVLGVVRKFRGSPFSCLLHFYVTIFQTVPTLPLPVCIYEAELVVVLIRNYSKKWFCTLLYTTSVFTGILYSLHTLTR
jgi:hypothetical protein